MEIYKLADIYNIAVFDSYRINNSCAIKYKYHS